MKQQYIEFEIVHQQIRRTDDFFVVGGSVNYLKARFKFCDDWQDEEQIAVFSGGGHAYAVPIVDGECFVPWEVLRLNLFFVSCMAGERITSNSVVVDVCPCGTSDDLEESLEPTPTVIDEKIAAAVDKYMQDIPNKEEAATDVTDIVNEMLQSDAAMHLNEGDFLRLIANALYTQCQPGSYISHSGLGQYELYYSADFSSGGVSMKFMGNSAEFFINDLGEWSGFVLYNGETGQKVFYYVGDKQVSYGLTGLADPTEDSGAANKKYVDSAIQTALAAIPIAEEGAY